MRLGQGMAMPCLEIVCPVRYRVHMIHVSFSELRRRLAHFMDRAVDDRAPVLVTRQGHEPVVMLAQSDYDSMVETLHLLSTPANRRALEQALAEAERGEGIAVKWDEAAGMYRPA